MSDEVDQSTVYTFRDEFEDLDDMGMVPWYKVKEFVKQSHEMTEMSYETSRRILEMYEDSQIERIRAMGVVLVHQVVVFLLALAFLFVLLGH